MKQFSKAGGSIKKYLPIFLVLVLLIGCSSERQNKSGLYFGKILEQSWITSGYLLVKYYIPNPGARLGGVDCVVFNSSGVPIASQNSDNESPYRLEKVQATLIIVPVKYTGQWLRVECS